MATTNAARAAHRALQEEANRAGGQLALDRADYEERSEALFGRRRVLTPRQMLASIAASASPTFAPARQLRSQLEALGEAPDGFGKDLVWDPDDKQLAAVVFVNPADFMGVTIKGVRKSDTIEIVGPAQGIATFARSGTHDIFSSILGVVGDVIDIFDLPLEDLIKKGLEFAREKFAKMGGTKPRNAFGREPKDGGHRARQEGGVILSLPGRNGKTTLFTSGKEKDRWIKAPGLRDPENYPKHVSPEEGFFLRGGSKRDRATARHDGDIVIRAWDHIFEDNLGFYQLNVLLKRAA